MDATDLRTRDFRRILLIKLSAIGDVVHSLPVLAKLRRRYPGARIDWLITSANAELVRHNPALTNVVLFDREQWAYPWGAGWSGLRDTARLCAELRATRYDLVIDLHGQMRTALFTLATGAPVRIGFARPNKRLWAASGRRFPAEAKKHAWTGAREGSWLAYTHRIPVPILDAHAVDRYLRLGPMLGLDDGPAEFSFSIPPATTARVEHMLNERGIAAQDGKTKLLVIVPGTNWETKQWLSDRFADVGRHYVSRGWHVVLVGSAREHATCQVVAKASGAVDFSGQTTLGELAALMHCSTLCVTNDSGPMHLAVALDRPVVSIFGPTDSLWVGPYLRPNAVLRADLPCAPCYLRQLRRCNFGHACMKEISSQAVIKRIETVLAAQADAGRDPARRVAESA